MTIDINNLRRLALDGDLAAMQAIIIRLERTEKERDALCAKTAEMEKTWLSPEGYHILMQEREDMLFQAEKMKQHAPCKDISMWPTHHTQPTQPAPSFADAYQGAMEDVAIWKKRALEAEDLNRKFIAEINGPMLMGEPVAQPAPSVPEGWLRAIDEALLTAHIGVANAHDTYEQAKAKLDNLIGLHVDIATDPAVNGGWKLVPIVSTHEMDYAGSEHCDGYLSTAQVVWDAMLAAAPEAKP